MIKEASQRTVLSILGKDNVGKESIYLIPPYQREYSWSKEQWDNLFNDIYESEQSYFLGSIICILKENSENLHQHVDVIDGQQRLTTINILLLAIYKHFDILKNTPEGKELYIDNEEIQAAWLQLKRLFFSNQSINKKFTPSIQNNNKEDFFYLLEHVINNQQSSPPYWGNRRIAKAYSFFFSQIEELLDSRCADDERLHELFTFLEKITSALMVRIDTEDAASAFILFESINNRGLPLTPIDLIKNNLIGHNTLSPEATNQQWQTLIKNLNEYDTQVRYLRHFYHAFSSNESIKVSGFTKVTKSNLITIYTTLIKRDVKFILNELISKSYIYKVLATPEDIIEGTEYYKYKEQLIAIKKLGVVPAYSLLLSLFHRYPNENFLELLIFIEKWFIVRHLTNTPATSKLDQIFIDLIDADDLKNQYCFLTIKKRLLAHTQSKEIIKNKLIEYDLYTDNPNLLRYLLIHLEEKLRTKETKTDFGKIGSNGKPIWSIEHIFPQTPKDITKWSEDCSPLLHRLGNLTLTAYNSNLSNQDFNYKSSIKDNLGNNIGLKSGNVKINNMLINQNYWTIEDICNRSNELAELFIKDL